MLWNLLAGSGYASGYASPFVRADETVHPLDPVECAGQARITALQASLLSRNLLILVSLVGIITDHRMFESVLIGELLKKKLNFTNAKYTEHFHDLDDYGLIRQRHINELMHCSTYFAVPKSETADRAIFNGKKFSVCCKTPPSSNLV